MEPEQHVHFDESEDDVKSNDIVVRVRGRRGVEVQLGFLQLNRIYEVTVLLPNAVFAPEAVEYVQKDTTVPNLNCRVVTLRDTPSNNVTLKLRYVARKERLAREKIVLTRGVAEEEVKVEVVARVLGKGKGTPMVRDGIVCVGMEEELDDTEASDWQGFD